VVHVIAESEAWRMTPVQLDGEETPRPGPDKPVREMTIAEALAPDPPTGPAQTNPAVVMGGGISPRRCWPPRSRHRDDPPLVHPGMAAPEPRYVPSRQLADFVRCRDLTCRFPGCDEPAYRCDLDHTIPYPVGRRALDMACLCRKHHLLKTFCGWLARRYLMAPSSGRAPAGRPTPPPG